MLFRSSSHMHTILAVDTLTFTRMGAKFSFGRSNPSRDDAASTSPDDTSSRVPVSPSLADNTERSQPKDNDDSWCRIPKDNPIEFRPTPNKTEFNTEDFESLHEYYANEARKWIVGPMSVDYFLSSFLPEPDTPTQENGHRDGSSGSAGGFEHAPIEGPDMCQSLVCSFLFIQIALLNLLIEG